MRVLVLGGNGQIGHRVWMAARDRHETWVTLRRGPEAPWGALFAGARIIGDVEAGDPATLDRALAVAQPDVAINLMGIVKQHRDAGDVPAVSAVNSFAPHHLARRCAAAGIRFITLGTDCVYRGDRGSYLETDPPDATDVYGISKCIGEVGGPGLTIRTSHIGRSLVGSLGLLEWFLGQSVAVEGHRKAVYSGLTTLALADTILRVVEEHPDLSGLWHVAGERISKLDLLLRVRDAYRRETHITPVDGPAIDRTLDDTRFRDATGIPRPTWSEMLPTLAGDPTPYDRLRGG